MRLDIEKAVNGYICSWWGESEDDDMTKNAVIFEEAETETGGLDCMVNMLYFVKEHFGHIHSKHNKYNINIKVVKNKDIV